MISLRHVSALKGTTSGSMTDTCPQQGQQNESPDVKFSLVSSVYCANVPAIWSHMADDSLCSNVMLKYINCTVLTCQPYGVTWLVTHFVQRDAEMYQLYCANVPAIWSHMTGDSLCST